MAPDAVVHGRVADATRAAVVAAKVTMTSVPAGVAAVAITNREGEFTLSISSGRYVIRISATGFSDASQPITVTTGSQRLPDVTLTIADIQESVTVGATAGYSAPAVSSATKTLTPLRDVPQAVSIVTSTLVADQAMTSMADVTRYMPGVGFAQGEGNRDTPIIRGNSSTSDFFVDGVRDDAQYFRDVYNVDRIEALKGPNAMIFGRGGVGGVINRVTRRADWGRTREASFQVGSWDNKRFVGDVGHGVNGRLAVRATGMYEHSGSYRDRVGIERYGFNPTVAVRLGANTTLRGSYEYFHDMRTADRGVTSFNGSPVPGGPGTFFGDPEQSHADATVNVVSGMVDHQFNSRVTLRHRVSYADYDKFYQNVFPGAVSAATMTVAISAYNNATTRQNLFNQTDVVVAAHTGRVGHTLLLGAELGRQNTANVRNTGYFPTLGASVTVATAPLTQPTISLPVTFRPSATDADNHGITTIGSVYAQDQVALSAAFDAVIGLRFDRFNADVRNHRTATTLSSSDGLVSPRLGLIYKPAQAVSFYGSYSLTYLPRAGEQLSSLTLTNQALDPEQFRNYEIGAKWDAAGSLSVTAAAYRLDRGNVVVPDANDPALSILVDAQRTRGVEIGVDGNLTRTWSMVGGYAYQDGRITRFISATAQAGARLAQLPRHSFSLWNKLDVTPRFAAALGIICRDEVFTSTDNLVRLPAWFRMDAAAYYHVTRALRAQVNMENVFDRRYYVNAHSNTNITPGSPRAIRATLTTRF